LDITFSNNIGPGHVLKETTGNDPIAFQFSLLILAYLSGYFPNFRVTLEKPDPFEKSTSTLFDAAFIIISFREVVLSLLNRLA
jgi:hypothetical protein